METVARCEARAILKAVQEAHMGGTVHVHTDSQSTVMELKALAEKGEYKKKRKLQNKGLVGQILLQMEEKSICLIVEWVKGHETMEEDKLDKQDEEGWE